MTKTRIWAFLFCVALGIAFGVITWKGGFGATSAVINFLVPSAFGIWFGFGRGQIAGVYGDPEEERNKYISRQAGYITTMIVGFAAIAGQLFEMSQGRNGIFSIMAVGIWSTYLLSIAVLTKKG